MWKPGGSTTVGELKVLVQISFRACEQQDEETALAALTRGDLQIKKHKRA